MYDFAGFGNVILGVDVFFLHKNGGVDLGFRIRKWLFNIVWVQERIDLLLENRYADS